MTRRLRVGFTPDVYAFPPTSGTGKMWHRVLAELAGRVELRGIHPAGFKGRIRRRLTPVQTWLHNGHFGPLRVTEPVVAELHEAAWDLPETRDHMDPEYAAHFARLSESAARAATMVITLSESSKRQIVEFYGVPAERVVVAPLGVDQEVFHPEPGDPVGVLAAAGGDPGRPYVLFVSQLHPRKNLGAVREAMTRLAAQGFPHQLVVVGNSPTDRHYDADLVANAVADLPGTSGRVVHLQNITDTELAQVMAGAAAFCLPSFMEGFGLTALEAMACGAPVVVSDRGALPEVVHDAGIVVTPDADAIEAALSKIFDDTDLAERLRRAGIERSRRFTWQATADGWLSALEAAANGR